MALTNSGYVVTLLVAKPATGTKAPLLYVPTTEDLNKFDFAHAKVVGYYDSGATAPAFCLIDTTSYYP
jgi:hypothetical protein